MWENQQMAIGSKKKYVQQKRVFYFSIFLQYLKRLDVKLIDLCFIAKEVRYG